MNNLPQATVFILAVDHSNRHANMLTVFVCLEDKVWTTVMNNLPPRTTVTGSSRERRTVLQVNYSASMDQVTHTSIRYILKSLKVLCVTFYISCKPTGKNLFKKGR